MANTGHMDDDQPHGRTRADLFGTAGNTLRLREGVDGDPGDDASDAEARMRAALGLFGSKPGQAAERASHHEQHSGGDRRPTGGGGTSGGPGARRHRFVQDGEVPVSVVRGRLGQQRPSGSETDRQAEELAHERQLRAETERKLADKEIQLRSLQTRIGHAELERDNAVAELREWREKALAAAPTAPSAPEVAPEVASDGPPDRAPGPPPPADETVAAAQASIAAEDADADMPGLGAAQRARRGPRRRPEEPQLDFVDPEPVKWWL